MEDKIEFANEIEETGNYLHISFILAPKKESGGTSTAWREMGAMAQRKWGNL
jgi:hypothetical protein